MELTNRLLTVPVLIHFDADADTGVYTDTSNQQPGAVLAQLENDVETVFAYTSQTIHKIQCHVFDDRKECLAVVPISRSSGPTSTGNRLASSWIIMHHAGRQTSVIPLGVSQREPLTSKTEYYPALQVGTKTCRYQLLIWSHSRAPMAISDGKDNALISIINVAMI